MRAVNVGMVGMGTVGGATLRILDENAAEIERRCGFPIHVRAAASLEVDKREEISTPAGKRFLSRDWHEAVEHPEVEVVVEVVGGTTLAYEIQKAALTRGGPLVTR